MTSEPVAPEAAAPESASLVELFEAATEAERQALLEHLADRGDASVRIAENVHQVELLKPQRVGDGDGKPGDVIAYIQLTAPIGVDYVASALERKLARAVPMEPAPLED